MSNEAFLSAMRRVMAVADPEDVRIIVENANDAVAAMRERCAVEAYHVNDFDAYGIAADVATRIRALK